MPAISPLVRPLAARLLGFGEPAAVAEGSPEPGLPVTLVEEVVGEDARLVAAELAVESVSVEVRVLLLAADVAVVAESVGTEAEIDAPSEVDAGIVAETPLSEADGFVFDELCVEEGAVDPAVKDPS